MAILWPARILSLVYVSYVLPSHNMLSTETRHWVSFRERLKTQTLGAKAIVSFSLSFDFAMSLLRVRGHVLLSPGSIEFAHTFVYPVSFVPPLCLLE